MPLQYLRTIHSTYPAFHLQWKFGEALCLLFFFFFLFFKFQTVATVVTVFFGLPFVLFFYILLY